MFLVLEVGTETAGANFIASNTKEKILENHFRNFNIINFRIDQIMGKFHIASFLHVLENDSIDK